MFIFLWLEINKLTSFDILLLLFSTFTHSTNTSTGRAPDPSSECINQNHQIYLQLYWIKLLLPHRSLAPWNAIIHQRSKWNILKFWKKEALLFCWFWHALLFFHSFSKKKPFFFFPSFWFWNAPLKCLLEVFHFVWERSALFSAQSTSQINPSLYWMLVPKLSPQA